MRITHPFHPARGQTFKYIDQRYTWGDTRVYYVNHQGHQKSVSIGFTDVLPPDPFVSIAAGRCLLSTQSLIDLLVLVNASQDHEAS